MSWKNDYQTFNPLRHNMKTIDERFAEFDALHPQIYTEFVKQTMKMINRGFKAYSADTICHIIRFHTDLDGRDTEPFKINNDYTSRYARKFMNQFPKHEGFFRTRELISITKEDKKAA